MEHPQNYEEHNLDTRVLIFNQYRKASVFLSRMIGSGSTDCKLIYLGKFSFSNSKPRLKLYVI